MSSTALIYIRQSRHKDYERTASPEVQEEACRDLLAVQGCEDIIVYKDLDVSGGKLKRRRQWLALRTRLDEATKDDNLVIALYDQSRAFRNTADALELYSLLERKPWIEVVLVHGRFDRSPAGEFTYTAMAAAHAMERRMTAEKMREAKRFQSARGEAVGPIPAGYKRVRDENGTRVEIDETTAPIVRQLFAEYASGRYGSRTLAHRFNAAGLTLPANTGPREIRGKGLHGDTVMQVLSNVAYIGKTYSISRRHREGDIIDAQWPALIEIDVWDAVQRRRKANTKPGRATGVNTGRRQYAFQGLLRCVCGRRLAAQTMKGNAYYRCLGSDAPDRCRTKMVREDSLLPWGRSVMQGVEILAAESVGHRVARLTAKRGSEPDSLERVDESLRRADFMFYAAQRWDQEQYLAEVARLSAIRTELRATLRPERKVLVFPNALATWDSGDALARRQLLSVSCSTPSMSRTPRSSPGSHARIGRPMSPISWTVW